MRSNFRPNIILASNILLVIGTFAIALKIAPIAEVYRSWKVKIFYFFVIFISRFQSLF